MNESYGQCYFHSQKQAAHLCSHCGKPFCEQCIIHVEGEPFCQICWNGFTIQSTPITRETKRSDEIPWQRWRELGIAHAFFDTARMVLFHPSIFFAQLPARKNYAAPLLFAMICILLFWFPINVLYIKYVYPAVFQQIEQGAAPIGADVEASITEQLQVWRSLSHLDLLKMPVDFLLLYIIVASFFQQALVTMFHGKEGYWATLQIRCYAMTVQCLWLIPFLGFFLAEIFSFILCMCGFRVAQKLAPPQAFLVASVPMVLYVILLMTAM